MRHQILSIVKLASASHTAVRQNESKNLVTRELISEIKLHTFFLKLLRVFDYIMFQTDLQ